MQELLPDGRILIYHIDLRHLCFGRRCQCWDLVDTGARTVSLSRVSQIQVTKADTVAGFRVSTRQVQDLISIIDYK